MDSLPVNFDDPAVKEYLALVRLQVLTPFSLLINMVTVLVCSLAAKPGIGRISKLYPTSISPRPAVAAAYILAIYIFQVGFCLLLVLARKPETKRTLVKGVGISLMGANWVMAFWAVAWVMQAFVAATVLQGVLLLLLVYANVVLFVYHEPTGARPFDTALVHAPMRFFLILPLSMLFPISLFIALGMYHQPSSPGYSVTPWPGLLVVLGVNLLGLLVVVVRRDIVWCVAATWICISVWSADLVPGMIVVTEIVFTVLHPLALVCSMAWMAFRKRRKQHGPIALPEDAREGEAEHGNGNRRAGEDSAVRVPRELNAEELWG